MSTKINTHEIIEEEIALACQYLVKDRVYKNANLVAYIDGLIDSLTNF